MIEYHCKLGRKILHFPEQYVIAHQSESKVLLKKDEVVTLFCVSSTHCWMSEYDWTCNAEPTGVSSLVLYAKLPGHYQCVVTLKSTSEVCISDKIEVLEGKMLLYMQYSHSKTPL